MKSSCKSEGTCKPGKRKEGSKKGTVNLEKHAGKSQGKLMYGKKNMNKEKKLGKKNG